MPRDLSPVLPNILYDRGFSEEQEGAYWDLAHSPTDESHWSSAMTTYIAASSLNHFIDRYNRALALNAISNQLQHAGTRYVDVGCSTGYLLSEVSAACPRAQVFGTDFSISGLRSCHLRLPEIPLLRMDVTQTHLADNLFDAVTCLNVLEHVEKDDAALRELGRILKPEGRLFVSVPAGPHLYDSNDEIHFHVRRYDLAGLREKIEHAGLNLLAINYFGFFPYPAFYLQKRFNQMWRAKRSFEEKHRRAERQANESGRLRFMEWVCSLEQAFGAWIRFPFGIRLQATITKNAPSHKL